MSIHEDAHIRNDNLHGNSQDTNTLCTVEEPTQDRSVALHIETMLFLAKRLNADDYGRLSRQIARAAGAKRPSELQRLLLAIVGRQPTACTEVVA